MRKAKKLYAAIALALAAMLVASTAALALVTFNAQDGTGFVGKGDVQTVLGLNNKDMQTAHTSVTFKYVATNTYGFECEWFTGPARNRTHHVQDKTADTQVNATVDSASRKTGQWTGWNLNGFVGGAPNSVAEPTDADCGAEGNQMKTIVRDEQGNPIIELISSSGGLYAVYGGNDYLIHSV